LAEAVAEEEHRDSMDEVARRHRVIFVMHSEEVSQALETFAAEKACLERVVPGRGGYEEADMKGSWLMFEKPE
jgi:hypothetical protein